MCLRAVLKPGYFATTKSKDESINHRPDTHPQKKKKKKNYSTKLNQIQYATLYQPKLEDSCTEQ